MSFPQASIPTLAPPPYQAPPSHQQQRSAFLSDEEKSFINEKAAHKSYTEEKQSYEQPRQMQQYASTSRSPSSPPTSSSPSVNRERFNSPFATNPEWSPSPSDVHLKSLPTLDIGLRIKQRFSRSPGNPFSPEAPSFSRTVPSRANGLSSFGHFDAFALPGKGINFGDGFKPYYPGNYLVDHDVSSADWERFLEDIEVCGRLSAKDRLISGLSTAPLGMMGAPIGAFFAQRAMERKMKKAKEPAVVNAVETWSQRFFLARGLDVFLVEKGERCSSITPEASLPTGFNPLNVRDLDNRGLPLNIPFLNQAGSSSLGSSDEANVSRTSVSSSSSSSSSSTDSSVEITKHEKATMSKDQLKHLRKERKAMKKEARKERKEARKEKRRERKDSKKDRKEARKEKKREKRGKKKDGVTYTHLVVQPASARGVTPPLSVQDPFQNFGQLQIA